MVGVGVSFGVLVGAEVGVIVGERVSDGDGVTEGVKVGGRGWNGVSVGKEDSDNSRSLPCPDTSKVSATCMERDCVPVGITVKLAESTPLCSSATVSIPGASSQLTKNAKSASAARLATEIIR